MTNKIVNKIKEIGDYFRGNSEEEREKEMGKYAGVVQDVISKIKGGEKEMNAALHILSSEKAIEAYEILQNNKVSYPMIKRVMANSLNNFQRGRGLTIGSYAMGIAEGLSNSERYFDVIEEMYNEEVIGERQYKTLQKTIGENIKGGSEKLREGLSTLEKRITASVLGIFGLGILASGIKVTGGAIGVVPIKTILPIVGLALVIASLVLFLSKKKF